LARKGDREHVELLASSDRLRLGLVREGEGCLNQGPTLSFASSG